MTDKIKALFIFEILGKPPEHIKGIMSQLVDRLGEFPGIKIDKKIVHEPKPIEEERAKDLFTTFSEVEITGDDINSLLNIVFNAMPSHIEIIEPEELKFRKSDISSLLSGLTVKLHRYDEVAKTLVMERNMLLGKLKELKGDLKVEDLFEKKPDKNKEKKKTKKSTKKNNSKKKR